MNKFKTSQRLDKLKQSLANLNNYINDSLNVDGLYIINANYLNSYLKLIEARVEALEAAIENDNLLKEEEYYKNYIQHYESDLKRLQGLQEKIANL